MMEASCEERILENGAAPLVVNNVVFAGNDMNGPALDGALIYTCENLTLSGVTASSNVATSANSVALFSVCGDVTVSNTTIVDTALSGTGTVCGIFCSGEVTMTNSSLSITNLTGGTSVCGVFCSGPVTMTDSAVVGSILTSGDNMCGFFCSNNTTITRSAILDTTGESADGGCAFACVNEVVMTDSMIHNTSTVSTATSGWCSGLFCSNDVTMTRSSIDRVTTSGDGFCAGLFCSNDLTFVQSTVTGLNATSTGGYCGSLACAGDLVIVNSTFGANTASGLAAEDAQFSIASATLVYATVVGNQADAMPLFGGIDLTTFGSVIVGTGGPSCVDVTTTSNGYNFADDTSCDLVAATDTQGPGLDPMLGAMADNGGPGRTMLPQAGSPLIDAIPAAACQSDGAAGITTDERGLPRPALGGCDIGAVEVQPAPPPLPEDTIAVTPRFPG